MQEPEYFERQQVESLPAQMADHFQAIGEGVGEKIGQFIYGVTMFISGMTIAFYSGPVFLLIALAYLPMIIIAISIFGVYMLKQVNLKLEQQKKLGAHTEEMLSALKLVVSFAQEDLTIEKYDEIAKKTLELSKKASVIYSIMHGFSFALVFGFFCYCYAVGGYLIYNEKTNPSTGEIYKVADIIQV